MMGVITARTNPSQSLSNFEKNVINFDLSNISQFNKNSCYRRLQSVFSVLREFHHLTDNPAL